MCAGMEMDSTLRAMHDVEGAVSCCPISLVIILQGSIKVYPTRQNLEKERKDACLNAPILIPTRVDKRHMRRGS